MAVQTLARVAAVTIACAAISLGAVMMRSARAAEGPVHLVALGDSLVAGYGLSASDAFPAKLQRALAAKGLAVEITDAGVSGDTSTDGLGRLDWSVPDGTEGVILELGANDALRGVDPKLTRQALDTILRRLKERRIPVLLCGMRAPPNLGEAYRAAFDPIFSELASTYGGLYYPFFLDGVAAQASLNQRDGLHPTATGVDVIVGRILPSVEALVDRVRSQRGS
jgi:acyl-CoA thioesterase-1